ncbi:MAG: thiamine pyrophosphate-binding protein [Gammaproteobacteria bacterium]|nr:thiamine pyrophosphate-binding protein [Gammaproteobacteria bacterium]
MSAAAVSGSKRLCAALQRAGIEHVFGLPGSQTVALFEALRGSQLRTIVATHESSAAMMANGYFRASGKPAALLTIPGPGFTWALSGLAEAALDSAALLHVTCAPAASPGRAYQLQTLDQDALAAPLTKRAFTVARTDDLPAAVADAYAECLAGEPGPVLLQIEKDVWEQICTAGETPAPGPDHAAAVHPDDVAAAAQAVAAARRCILLLGQGCLGAADLACQLAERLNAIVVTTTSGRGVVPEDHRLSLGFELGNHRPQSLNALVEASDLVLAIGCKFSHNGSRGFRLRIPQDKLIHVDASQRVLGANYPAHLAIHADAKGFLAALLPQLAATATKPGGFYPAAVEQWRERCRTEDAYQIAEPRIHGVPAGKPEAFFAALRRTMPRASCLVTDSGQHQDLARRYFRVLCPRGLITPTNLQSMGFGIGAAMGACLADPERRIVALIGDGGLAISGLELLTAVRERLRLTVIVFADGAFGAIRNQQLAASGRAFATALPDLDCAGLAAAIGANYLRLDADADSVLSDALQAPCVTLVEVALGDSLPMHWTRARGTAKSLLGPQLKTRLRAIRNRGRQ